MIIVKNKLKLCWAFLQVLIFESIHGLLIFFLKSIFRADDQGLIELNL